ncbi:MAG: hypothetical protein ACM3S1_06750 [Hyphomicrobiales bacterium]
MFERPPRDFEPRASRIPLPPRITVSTEVWMGGADARVGEDLHPEHLADAWLVDLSGEMPEPHRAAAALWLPRVFGDVESVPTNLARLAELANSLAACLRGEAPTCDWEHPAEPPGRLYVMCQQGLNRSGLVTGLVLRALGLTADEALAAIATRPGALNNLTYARLVREFEPGNGAGNTVQSAHGRH